MFESEGGYTFRSPKDDPGGATNMGITLAALKTYRGKPVTPNDVKNLQRPEAEAIYRQNYWNAIKGDTLPSGLDVSVFDFAVNSGPSRAVKILQKIVGTDMDGSVGKGTLDAVAAYVGKYGIATLIKSYNAQRVAFLKTLPNFKANPGWIPRVNRTLNESLTLI